MERMAPRTLERKEPDRDELAASSSYSAGPGGRARSDPHGVVASAAQ